MLDASSWEADLEVAYYEALSLCNVHCHLPPVVCKVNLSGLESRTDLIFCEGIVGFVKR